MKKTGRRMEAEYRHEYKYLVSENALTMLSFRLKGVMRKDPHAGNDGRYMIRSVYFDDVYDTCFNENASGADRHEKFRIRAYNADSSFITLELKIKEHGKTKKLSETIDEDIFRFLVYGEGTVETEKSLKNLGRKLLMEKRTRLLKPKVIIQYEREPFLYDAGNVRVTFDRFISASPHIDRMFEKNAYALPVLPENIHLLEVKWDDFLPGIIGETLKNDRLQQMSFSKYFLGRQMLCGSFPTLDNKRRAR